MCIRDRYKRNDIKATTLAEFIMPKKPLNLLKNIIDNDQEVTIEYNNSNAKFDMDGLTVCKLAFHIASCDLESCINHVLQNFWPSDITVFINVSN